MPRADLHNTMRASRGISPAAASTNDDAFVSTILDTADFGSVEFVWLAGSIADADATFTLLVEHGDDSGLSDAAAVPDAQLIGTEAGAAPLFGSDNKCGKIGYIGTKRYVRVTITPANNTGNIFLAGLWLSGHASRAMQTTQVV